MAFIKNILAYFRKHKIVSIILFLVIVGGGYYVYAKATAKTTAPQYVTQPVTQGTLVVSVSGTGQVASSTQISVKPQVSSTVTRVLVKNGQQVQANDPLVELDATSAEKGVRDAKASLDSTQLSLNKLVEPADAVSLVQSQNSLSQAEDNLAKLKVSQPADLQTAQEQQQTATDNLTTGYENTFNEIANTFVDLPNIVSGLDDILHGQGIGKAEKSIGPGYQNESTLINTSLADDRPALQPFVDRAEADFQTANSAYNSTFTSYKTISRTSDRPTIDALLTQTIQTTKLIADAAKSETNLLDEWVTLRTARNATDYLSAASTVTTYGNNLNTDTSQVNGHLTNLSNDQSSISNNENSLASATRSIDQMNSNDPLDMSAAAQAVVAAQASLDKLKNGPDPIDVQSQKLALVEKQNALTDAEQQLSYYTVRTPIAGVASSITLNPSDPASSGTAVAIIVAPQQVANISLNEVDVAHVQVGQKATMTFDAIDGLTMTGKVVEIDTIGAVSQGVVSYNVQILFDTQNNSIKPGMSVSASIITDVHPDVLLAPSSAVKTQGQTSYVQTLQNGQPQRHTVQAGESSDSQTEVTGDVHEGDQVITQTITSTTTTPAATGGGLGGIRIPGVGGGGGFGGGRPGG